MPAQNLHRADEGGTYLHVFNKGIENSNIFRDKADFQVFLGFIGEYLSPPKDVESTKKEFKVKGRVFKGVPHQPKNYAGKVELFAYDLHPDHFHLIIHQKTPSSLQSFIRSLCTRYSMYFNKKYNRMGPLFVGPYKSVRLNDETLLLLTHHLHQSGDYSSYPVYLKLKKAPWVKTKTVLSVENDDGNHKDFVENYKLSNDEEKLLKSISPEDTNSHLERRDLAELSSKRPRRIPEFLLATFVFVTLFGLGMRNLMLTPAQQMSFPEPTALSRFMPKEVNLEFAVAASRQVFEKASATLAAVSSNLGNLKDAKFKTGKEVATAKNPPASSATLGTATSSASPAPKAANEPIILLTIKNVDKTIIDIREKPAVESKKIGEAKFGDSFEYVSKKSDWYEVKLPDSSTGFIASQYIETGGGN